MSSLSDQLLKAGLVTEEQVKKATEKPKKSKKRTPHTRSNNQSKNKSSTTRKKAKESSDLAQFYKQRASVERKEKQEAERKKQEEARIKKETNAKIKKLLTDNKVNDDSADIRYNFVVGTTIKYLFVTEKQQQQLADGALAISFLGGNRVLIPAEIGQQIQQLNPNKIVIVADTSKE